MESLNSLIIFINLNALNAEINLGFRDFWGKKLFKLWNKVIK